MNQFQLRAALSISGEYTRLNKLYSATTKRNNMITFVHAYIDIHSNVKLEHNMFSTEVREMRSF